MMSNSELELGQEEQEIEQEVEQEVEVNPDVEQASKGGWMPLEDWTSKDKDPDDWVSAKKFNERGQMMDSISSLRKQVEAQSNDFSSRITNLTKLQEARTNQTIADLKDKRDQAVDVADREEVNKIQGQIDELNVAPVNQPAAQPAQHEGQKDLDAWNANNSWINEFSPKSEFAKASFNRHANTGISVQEAIKMAEADIRTHFPPTNPRRDSAQSVEGGRSKPGQRSARKLAWSDLSATEEKLFNNMPGVFSKEEYLSAVADDRKGNQ